MVKRFDVGDKVRIKKNLKKGYIRDGTYVNDDMLKFCGMTTTIRNLLNAPSTYDYKLNIDEHDGYWSWSDDMLENAISSNPNNEV